jgi:hypothetical protein
LQSALEAAQKEVKLRDKAIQGLLLAQSKKANAEKNVSKVLHDCIILRLFSIFIGSES